MYVFQMSFFLQTLVSKFQFLVSISEILIFKNFFKIECLEIDNFSVFLIDFEF